MNQSTIDRPGVSRPAGIDIRDHRVVRQPGRRYDVYKDGMRRPLAVGLDRFGLAYTMRRSAGMK